jgi:hypothetical protein
MRLGDIAKGAGAAALAVVLVDLVASPATVALGAVLLKR